MQILSTSEGSQIAERDRINDKEVIAARKPKQSSITMTLFDTIMAEQIDEFDAVVESRLQAEREKSVDDRQHTEREAEREAADEDARRQAKIETAEEEARPQAEREAAEETARLEAEREAAKGAARLQTEKEAAEEAARLEAEREAVEEAARQQADRDKDKEEEQDIIVNMNPTIACDGQC